MSQENVEAFKRGIEAANRRDLEGRWRLDPQVEWHPALHVARGGRHGVSRAPGHSRALPRSDELFDKVHWEYADIRDLGDCVVGIGRFRMRGKGSGAETDAPGLRGRLPNGKAIRVQTYLDHNEALEAAGLSE